MDALSILALGVAQAGGGGGGGTSDYSDLSNKPQINSVTLSGNKSLSDLGIQGEITGATTLVLEEDHLQGDEYSTLAISYNGPVVEKHDDSTGSLVSSTYLASDELGLEAYDSNGDVSNSTIITPTDITISDSNAYVDISTVNGISVASGAPGMPSKGIFISPGMNTIDILDEDRSQQGMMPMASLGVSQSSELTVNGSAVAMKSDIPTVNNARLTIRRNGVAVRSFTANDNVDRSADILVPENTSDLTNDSGFITLSDVPKELPTISTGDAGKVLTVNSGETGVEWAAGGGGSSYTFTNGLTESSGIVSWNLNDKVKADSINNGTISSAASGATTIGFTNTGGHIAASEAAVGALASGACYDAGYIQVTGRGSFAGGYCIGRNITVSTGRGSLAYGYSDSTYGDISVNDSGQAALGAGVQTNGNNIGQIVLGRCNDYTNQSDKVLVIGNGTNNSNRSNALTVDWSGNLVCNNIPACPSTDGTYNLQVSIVNGVPTYSWVAV